MIKMEGEVHIGPDGHYLKMDGMDQRQNHDDPSMAIAAATGVSGGSTPTLCSSVGRR